MDKIDLRKRLRQLSLPVFVDMSLTMLVGTVDTFMLSRCGDGVGPVGAVGMVNMLVTLVFMVYQFLSTGVSVLCAQYYGAGKQRRFMQTVVLALALNATLGIAISATLFVFAEQILVAMGLRPEALIYGESYLRITGVMSVFPALSFALGASLRSAGKVKEPMIANGIANILNVIGNWALIFGHFGFPEMGVAGAALATASSRFIQFAILALMHRLRHVRLLVARLMRPFPWRELKNLFYVGIPSMTEPMSYCLSQTVVVYFINKISTEALATKAYCASLITFVLLYCVSVVQAGDILVGHLIGQKRYRPAYLAGNYFLRRCMFVTLTGSALLAIAGPLVLPMLTHEPDIISSGTAILAIDVILEIGRVHNIFACSTLRCVGDIMYPVVVGVTVQWLVGVGVACLLGLPAGLGIVGVWIGFLLDENLRGTILIRRWHSKRWMGRSFA
ncbi:MAG: MATE family efflux transporter [Kiritimatiellae bacterium]|nr:MATE family efflux transporter [Kiritimatiellia bacterium]